MNDKDLKILFAISRPPPYKRKKILDNILESMQTFQSVYLNRKEEIKNKENTIILNESLIHLYNIHIEELEKKDPKMESLRDTFLTFFGTFLRPNDQHFDMDHLRTPSETLRK